MDKAAIEDLFSPFARVSVRRMFSGHGVYIEDACFALALRGEVWLKADGSTQKAFAAAGSAPFGYETSSRSVTVAAFWKMPEAAFDDEDELRRWCALALEAARRTAAKKAAAKMRKRTAAKPRAARAPDPRRLGLKSSR